MPAILTPTFPIPQTVADLYIRVKRTFGDESGVQLEEADILRWANDGQLDIARKTHCLIKSESFNTGQGTYEIDVPVGFLFFDRATCDGRLLSSINYQQLDSMYPDRLISYPTGRPEYITFKGQKFELYPAPESSGDSNLIITYIARPATLQNQSDPLEIPDQYYEALVRFCLMRAKELDEDWTGATIFRDSYEKYIDGIFGDVHSVEASSYPSVRDTEDYSYGY